MSFRTPEIESDSVDEEYSSSQESFTMSVQNQGPGPSNNPNDGISEQLRGLEIPQEQHVPHSHQAQSFDLANIPTALYQALRDQIMRDILSQNPSLGASNFQSQPLSEQQPIHNQPASNFSSQHRPFSIPTASNAGCSASVSQWPAWDGLSTTFYSHLLQLQYKIEEDVNSLGSDRNICLGIFCSLPPTKQPRVLHWFETGGPDGRHNWRQFLDHVKSQFEDKQARQTAGNLLQRMRMGPNQYFTDFLQDFELKLSQCGGTNWPDFNKISYLNTGINATLRLLLMNKNLPDDDYNKWVNKVKNVAGRLENSPDYRPKGCSGKKTWFIPQNGNNFPPAVARSSSSHQHTLDAEGDTNMSGINSFKAYQAAINAFGANQNVSGDTRPRARWRTKEEFKQLVDEGKCTRCTKKGHLTRTCPNFRAAKRPAEISHIRSSANSQKKVITEELDVKSESDESDDNGSGEE